MKGRRITRVTMNDVPSLTNIHREAFRERLSEEDVRWYVRHCLTYWIKDVGYIVICPVDSYQRIEYLAVRPKYQRDGYGTRLLRHVLKKNTLRTTVMCTRRKVKFFEKLGFRKTRVFNHYWDGTTAILMIREA